MQDSIRPNTLKELAGSGAVRSVTLIGVPGGVAMKVRYGLSEKTLIHARGPQVRTWRRIDSAAAFARELGLAQVDLDLSNWVPEQTVLRG